MLTLALSPRSTAAHEVQSRSHSAPGGPPTRLPVPFSVNGTTSSPHPDVRLASATLSSRPVSYGDVKPPAPAGSAAPPRCAPPHHSDLLHTELARENGTSPVRLQNVIHIRPDASPRQPDTPIVAERRSPDSRALHPSLRAVEGMVRAVPIEGSGAPVTPRPGSCGGGALCAQDGEAQLPPVGDSPLQALGPGPPNSPHHAHVHINKQPRPRALPDSSGLPSSFQPTRHVTERHLQLEFDGDTVLCRVCGDKASGFHYGVHACEGCKGFFRRSIQQKIQYRPCLKNQQCNIIRVNRNRCQYCRLKKCIAVGMSRDAVRFGRVPKKEKAKIMEQMQKVNTQSQVNLLSTILESEGDVTQKILEAYTRTCEFTRTKFRGFCEAAWRSPQFVNCSAHLACPFNPSPESADGAKISEEFSECFTPAIRNVVNFAKSIPGFLVLSQEDQVTLLKAGTFEVLLVHLACLFDSQTNTMLFMNGKLFKRVSLTVTNSAGFLLDSMFDFADRMNALSLSDDEVALFSAIVIIASDRPGLRNVEQVEKVQTRITQALQALMASNHPDDPSRFAKLLMKIPDLRTLNTLHSEKLLGLQVLPSPGKNGGQSEKMKMSPDSEMAYFQNGMLAPGLGMLSSGGAGGAGGGPSQALTPAEVAHQVSMAASQQALMEARLQQLHPSFRGFNPYSTAATAMHMKHYQTSVAEMGKCPFPRSDKVKCERPNGYKSESVVPLPESSQSSADVSRRFYESQQALQLQPPTHKPGGAVQSAHHHRFGEDTQQEARDMSMSAQKDMPLVNGGCGPNDLHMRKNPRVPYWMMPRDLAGQGQPRSEERSDKSPLFPGRDTAQASGEKRPAPDREEDPKRKVAKIWDVPVGEPSGKDSRDNSAAAQAQAFHAARMYPGFGSHGMPGAQPMLPFPGYPGAPRTEFPFGPVLPPHLSGSLPRSNMMPPKLSPTKDDPKDNAAPLSKSPVDRNNKDSSSPSTPQRAESSLNLPVLKSVLSSPPLSNPALWGEGGKLNPGQRRHSNGDASHTAPRPIEDRSRSEDYSREKATRLSNFGFQPISASTSTSPGSKSISPLDPYAMHKKLKVKHHRTSMSSGSDRSTPASSLAEVHPAQTPPNPAQSPPNAHHPTTHSHPCATRSPHSPFSPMLNGDRRPSSSELELMSARRDTTLGVDFRDPPRQLHSNSESAQGADTMPKRTIPESDLQNDETLLNGRNNLVNMPKDHEKPHKVNYHDIRDHIAETEDRRDVNGGCVDADCPDDWGKDTREGRSDKESQLGAPGFLHSRPPGPALPPPPPHPAYIPQMGFSPSAGGVHPALLYQYNQYAAGLQLAQLQHLQMAQAAHLAHMQQQQQQASKERAKHAATAPREQESSDGIDQLNRESLRPSPPLVSDISLNKEIQVKQEPV